MAALATMTSLFWTQRAQTPPEPPPPAAPIAVAAPHYAGAAVCASCHDAQHTVWHGSDHDHAMNVADTTSVLGDFNDAKFTYAGTTSTFIRRADKFIVNRSEERV